MALGGVFPRRRMRVPAHTFRPRPRLNNSRKVTRRLRIHAPIGECKPIHRLRRARPVQRRASSTGYPPPCQAISRAIGTAAPNPAESSFEEAEEVSYSPLRLVGRHLEVQSRRTVVDVCNQSLRWIRFGRRVSGGRRPVSPRPSAGTTRFSTLAQGLEREGSRSGDFFLVR